MIRHDFRCNLCECHIHYHPAYGADCLTLYFAGPIGLEGTVLSRDTLEFPGHSQHPSPHEGVHICNRCEKGLASYFAERKPK